MKLPKLELVGYAALVSGLTVAAAYAGLAFASAVRWLIDTYFSPVSNGGILMVGAIVFVFALMLLAGAEIDDADKE